MNAHHLETVLTENGTLTLRDLPFQAGDAVEVIILERHKLQPSEAPTSPSDSNPYPLRGTVIRYDDPTEPVALEDWEVLQ